MVTTTPHRTTSSQPFPPSTARFVRCRCVGSYRAVAGTYFASLASVVAVFNDSSVVIFQTLRTTALLGCLPATPIYGEPTNNHTHIIKTS